MKKSASRTILSGVVLATSLCLLSGLLFGCGKKEKDGGGLRSDIDTLTLEKSGITLEEYTESEEITREDLEKFVEKEMASAKGAKLRECAKKDDKIYLKTVYDDASAYTGYTGYELYFGKVLDGRIAGLSFGSTMYKVEGGKIQSEAYTVSDSDSFAAVVQEISVKVPGKIIAVSDPDAIVKKDTAFVHGSEDEGPVYIIYE